jgi:hypothetical protein
VGNYTKRLRVPFEAFHQASSERELVEDRFTDVSKRRMAKVVC